MKFYLKLACTLVPIALSTVGLLFSLYAFVRVDRLSAKSDISMSHRNWQIATIKMNCYYNQVSNRSELPADFGTVYKYYGSRIEESKAELSKDLKKIDGFGLGTLEKVVNSRILWDYGLQYEYQKDLILIKKALSDDELKRAELVCNADL